MNSDLYNFWLNTCHPMMYRDDVVYKMTYDKEQDNLVVTTVSANKWDRDYAFCCAELTTQVNGSCPLDHFTVVEPVAAKLWGDK